MRLWSKSILSYVIKTSGIYYKAPSNLSYWWNFGFIALFFLLSQIVTGIILAMFYNANAEIVFGIVFDLTSEIYYGWWLRNIHANGASFFFLAVYLHMARSIYYGSYMFPRQVLWVSGTIIWVLMIATAFLGYILPWGQMSFWGAMVITSLLGAIPGLGSDILFLLWGSFSIDNATLMRFYSLHFTLPFIIMALSIFHFALLHEFGSSNPLGENAKLDNIPFIPYYSVKDIFSIIIIIIIFIVFIISTPDMLGHSDNFNIANSLVTPAHIVPEWYFLPLYAILRSVTNKLLGISLIAASIISILALPFICKRHIIRSSMFRPIYSFTVWWFFAVNILLGWIGSLPVIQPYLALGLHLTILFFIIIILLPLIGYAEKLVYLLYINPEPSLPKCTNINEILWSHRWRRVPILIVMRTGSGKIFGVSTATFDKSPERALELLRQRRIYREEKKSRERALESLRQRRIYKEEQKMIKLSGWVDKVCAEVRRNKRDTGVGIPQWSLVDTKQNMIAMRYKAACRIMSRHKRDIPVRCYNIPDAIVYRKQPAIDKYSTVKSMIERDMFYTYIIALDPQLAVEYPVDIDKENAIKLYLENKNDRFGEARHIEVAENKKDSEFDELIYNGPGRIPPAHIRYIITEWNKERKNFNLW